ncbi:MAG: hypothetical protein FWH21_00400 [Kiritimatiellaeota bacterium]|nr:hypothetical protein [Kiritimatiellota bacterium]
MKKKTQKHPHTPMTSSADVRRQQAHALGAIPSYPYPPPPLPGYSAAPLPQVTAPPQPQRPDVRPDENTFVEAIRKIAASAWRLKGIAFMPGTDDPADGLDPKQLKDLCFHLGRLYNSLGMLGVTVLDFTGQPFHAGMPVKVVSAKPVPGLDEEVVEQTLQPTLKFTKTGECYPGEVITLKPEEEEPAAPEATASETEPSPPATEATDEPPPAMLPDPPPPATGKPAHPKVKKPHRPNRKHR